MSTAISARKSMGRSVTSAIIAATLAFAGPAYAGVCCPGGGGGGGVNLDNDTATAITGDGGSAFAAINIVALNCLLLIPSCGDFGGGNATGGDSGPANAFTAS